MPRHGRHVVALVGWNALVGEIATDYAAELARLRPLAADGLVAFDSDGLRVTESGRLFLRNIAACFDPSHDAAATRRHARAV